jgi:hypothetical protein
MLSRGDLLKSISVWLAFLILCGGERERVDFHQRVKGRLQLVTGVRVVIA